MNTLTIIIIVTVAVHQFAEANDICEQRFHIISSWSQADCPPDIVDEETKKVTHKYYVVQDGGKHECFPRCEKFKTDLTLIQVCSEKNPCPPGYLCKGKEDEEHCVLDETSCHKYYVNYDKKDLPYFKAMWKPECLPDGTWAPKQCKGEKFTGRCFCFDAIGNRIDGHQWRAKAENMTCACSRKRADMQADKSNAFVSLHCDEEGNYEPLQCNDGLCWCAEPKSGEVISKIVTESMMKLLPCYHIIHHGTQYMRQCESQLYAQKKIGSELKTHGTVSFQHDNIICDADGTYGVYRIADGQATCVWKDNTPLGSWQLSLSDSSFALMDCRCARDLKLYKMAGLDPDTRGQCNIMGNYSPVQVKVLEEGGQMYYCVDSDGFQKSALSNKPLTEKSCATYK